MNKESIEDPQHIRVSVSEAARLFGVSSKTIRRALQDQELRYIVVRGRYKILFASLVHWSQQAVSVQRRRDQRGIGQWVERWRLHAPLYSPRPPQPRPNIRRTTKST